MNPPAKPEAFGCRTIAGTRSQPVKTKAIAATDDASARGFAKQKKLRMAPSRNAWSFTAFPSRLDDRIEFESLFCMRIEIRFD
jgi:hypothetical protein